MRKFAISDIHGCAKSFRALVQKKIDLGPKDELYLLGDYIDRGPDSKDVIDFIIELKNAGFKVHCLRGNHEDMMLSALNSKKDLDLWVYNGGGATLKSFRAQGVDQISVKYINLIKEFDFYLEVDNFLLVHAGLNFRQKDPLTINKDMLWIRYWTDRINKRWLGNRKIIYGHTPITETQIRADAAIIDKLQFLNIDCGCYYSHKQDKGKLCAFELKSQQLYFQENIEHA